MPLWPWLLVLALVLWPLDVFLRRVQVSRRDLATAGAWLRAIPGRRRQVAARPAPVEGMLAARDRAGGEAARAALRRETGAGEAATVEGEPEVASSASHTPATARTAPPPPSPPGAPATPGATSAAANEPPDTLARLRDAKRRARR
jgi:hypothetical protein